MYAARQYVWHWLTAVNEHSLHSPFVYELYTRVIRTDRVEACFWPVEKLRKRLLHSRELIAVESPGAASRVDNRPLRRISRIARQGVSRPAVSRLLYRLARHFGHTHLVELGTSLGLNTLYLASVPRARVATFEGCPATARLAQRHFAELHQNNIELITGHLDQTLAAYLESRNEPVDLAFLDANHRYTPTLRYFELLLAHSHRQTILAVDDIYWSKEMTRAWHRMQAHPRITLSLDLYQTGLLFLNPDLPKATYRLMY